MSYASMMNPMTAQERFERELPDRLRHPADADRMRVQASVVRGQTVYHAACPNMLCDWRKVSLVESEVHEAIRLHVQQTNQTAEDWANHAEELAALAEEQPA